MTKTVQVVKRTMVGSIVVVDALTRYSLLHSVCDLKIAQTNVQSCLINALQSEFGQNAAEATKNICCAKDEGAVDHWTATKVFKKFRSSRKNFDHQTKSARHKNVDSEAVLQAIKTNPASSTRREFGELDILQSVVVCFFHNHGKNIQNCRIVHYVTKILQNF